MNALRNAQYRHLEVRKIAGSTGGDVTGVDLSTPVTGEVLAETRIMHRITIRGDRPF